MSYRNQDGCWNCVFVFKYVEHDQYPEYYCTNHSEPRPKCGSLLLEEEFDYQTEENYMQLTNNWEEWSKKHRVHSCGICNKHEKVKFIRHFLNTFWEEKHN